jgi:hypothetical protein
LDENETKISWELNNKCFNGWAKGIKYSLPVWPDPNALLKEPILTSPSLRSVITSWSIGIGCLYTWKVCCPLWLLSRVTTNTLSNRNTCSFCKKKKIDIYRYFLHIILKKNVFFYADGVNRSTFKLTQILSMCISWVSPHYILLNEIPIWNILITACIILIRFDLLCLTPLSAIFQLYHGDQFVVEEAGVPRENYQPWASNW